MTQKLSATQLSTGKKVLGWSDSDEDTKKVSVFERRLKKAQAKQFAGKSRDKDVWDQDYDKGK